MDEKRTLHAGEVVEVRFSPGNSYDLRVVLQLADSKADTKLPVLGLPRGAFDPDGKEVLTWNGDAFTACELMVKFLAVDAGTRVFGRVYTEEHSYTPYPEAHFTTFTAGHRPEGT